MQVLDIVPRQSQMPQLTSRQGYSQISAGLEKPQPNNHIVSLMPDAVPALLQMEIETAVQPLSFYPGIERR